jgi:hypothetical protein
MPQVGIRLGEGGGGAHPDEVFVQVPRWLPGVVLLRLVPSPAARTVRVCAVQMQCTARMVSALRAVCKRPMPRRGLGEPRCKCHACA